MRMQELAEKGSSSSPDELKELSLLREEQSQEIVKGDSTKRPKEFLDPGYSHMAIATLMHQGFAHYVVTTNLDGLFRKAGLQGHVDFCCLHGDVFIERCTGCGAEFERNYRVRRQAAHVHDHRAVGSGTCEVCGCGTPPEWDGYPKDAKITRKVVVVGERPSQQDVTLAKITVNARRKWPNAVLESVNGVSVENRSDLFLQNTVASLELPLKFEFRVACTGGAKTGAGTTFSSNHLVGVWDEQVGTKDTHINFGEGLDERDLDEAQEHCRKADLCIVLGTSMSLRHVTHFPFLAKKTVIVNLQATPDDDRCYQGLRIWGTCDEVLQLLLQHLGVPQVEKIPPWRPKNAVSLDDLERLGFPAKQLALARHISKVAAERVAADGARYQEVETVESRIVPGAEAAERARYDIEVVEPD
jgi:NAD-dependent SIR2 family protein deacetylase